MSQKTVFIVLFRGVGGKTQLPTAALREALTAAGFENVATYINSGNAVVRSALARTEVIAQIAEITRSKFGFAKAIHAQTRKEWADLIARNPFPEAEAVPKFLHAAVLDGRPDRKNIDAIRAFAKAGEQFDVVGAVAYIHTPNGFGTSKLAERFDRLIGVGNTARNWNSVMKLDALAAKADEG